MYLDVDAIGKGCFCASIPLSLESHHVSLLLQSGRNLLLQVALKSQITKLQKHLVTEVLCDCTLGDCFPRAVSEIVMIPGPWVFILIVTKTMFSSSRILK